MAGNNAFNNNDSMDINELAALSGDVSPELIDQLQQKLTQDAKVFAHPDFNENDNTTLFEEPSNMLTQSSENANVQTPETSATTDELNQEESNTTAKSEVGKLDKSINDNFIKKYKAKLDKQKNGGFSGFNTSATDTTATNDSNSQNNEIANGEISELSNGTITEKEMTKAQQEYNDSLDLLDGNVKYSKYVIYVDPQNVDFIESLTVKERKNLINRILREQDDISITKKKFQTLQTIIKHSIIAILTITISIPIIYYAINASLEASINNHRRAETNWGTLYRDKGKINIKQP